MLSIRGSPSCVSSGPTTLSCSGLSIFSSVEMVTHQTHPEPVLCAGYICTALFLTVRAALPVRQRWAEPHLGPVHLQTLRTVGGLQKAGRQIESIGDACCTPPPTPCLGPVGENPALCIFFFPPVFYKRALSVNCVPGFGVRCPDRLAGFRHCSQKVLDYGRRWT